MTTFIKGSVLVFFFGTMLFFVACKSGLLNKREKANPLKMGGSKSAEIIPAKTDTPKTVKPHIYSSKSGRVFEPEENTDTTAKKINTPENPK
jgi:hypothetical protein